MCTASWLISDHSYQVFFNRDELVTRERALPPGQFEEQSVSYLAPIDGNEGGTWISVNEFGVTLCLLNNYTGQTHTKGRSWDFSSRGHIVRELAHGRTWAQVKSLLEEKDLSRYLPFDLLVFEPYLSPRKIAWDGVAKRVVSRIPMPISSSSFKTEEVLKSRLSQLADDREFSESQLTDFHSSHYPAKSAHSVCMHREDAGTVSFSHIQVNHRTVSFKYTDGPPCTNKAVAKVSLYRQTSP